MHTLCRWGAHLARSRQVPMQPARPIRLLGAFWHPELRPWRSRLVTTTGSKNLMSGFHSVRTHLDTKFKSKCFDASASLVGKYLGFTSSMVGKPVGFTNPLVEKCEEDESSGKKKSFA